MVQFSRRSFLEMISMYVRNIFPDNSQYIANLNKLLRPYAEVKFSRDQMLGGGVFDYLASLALRELHSDSTTQGKANAIALII